MIKIRNKSSIALGIFLALITAVGMALNNQIYLLAVFLLLFSVYLVLDGIFYHKTAILYILLGFTTLISVFVWLITQKTYLLSADVVIGIIIALVALLLGIGVFLGLLSEKWIHINT